MVKPLSTIAMLLAVSMTGACAVKENSVSETGQANTNSNRPSSLMLKSVPKPAQPVEPGKSVGEAAIESDPVMDKLVLAAKQDLQQRLGTGQLRADAITVLEAQRVTWPDSSVGCPRPGMMYMQVLTEGARIVLSANERIYLYHSGSDSTPTLCEKPSPVKPYRNLNGDR